MGDGKRSALPRTVLDAKIRERNMTLDEFAEYAARFAHDHGETGTISTRHLQRLIAGPGAGGTQQIPRPATRRLLERIFGVPLDELLASPRSGDDDVARCAADGAELARMIAAANRVDPDTVRLLAAQVDTTRRLDRRFGAATLLDALRLHAQHVESLLAYCTDGPTRRALAAVLTDAHTLAGWQSLDRGEAVAAWEHYRRAGDMARVAESTALESHALAEQAVVLADIGRAADSAEMSAHARETGRKSPPLLQAWLSAAHGEALAAARHQEASTRAFADAERLLPDTVEQAVSGGPYLALNAAHLARWQGHALARFGSPDAVSVLSRALAAHDVEFSRAEGALRTDLALAHLTIGDNAVAWEQHVAAAVIVDAVGSVRQRRRLEAVAKKVGRRGIQRPTS